MERCLDKEELKRFIEYELSEEMTANIFGHLAVCEGCREKVRCLLEEERGLLMSLSAELVSRRHEMTASTAPCLSRALILAYSNKALKEDQLKLVESHLEKCDNCMSELMRLQRLQNVPTDLGLDMSAMKEKECGVPDRRSVLEIVLKAGGGLLELLRHTGEVISLTPAGVVRGKQENKERPIIIRKDLKKNGLSVELTIRRELVESAAALNISLMKLSTEEFVSGIDVALSYGDTDWKRTTDADGRVEFHGLSMGAYGIKIAGESIASITIE